MGSKVSDGASNSSGISENLSSSNEMNEQRSKKSEKLADYIHPALYRLNKYDQRTGNELYHTLEVYL